MAKSTKKSNKEIREEYFSKIRSKLIAELESCNDTGRCVLPWNKVGMELSMPYNPARKSYYKGMNVLNLWMTTMSMGFTHNVWATYAQWKKLGATVNKGEKSVAQVYFWKFFEVEETNEATGEVETKKIPYMQLSSVFNADQVSGYEVPVKAVVDLNEVVEQVVEQPEIEEIIRNTEAKIVHGGDMACYIPSKDYIRMPNKNQFHSMGQYYHVAFHELAHWTGHESRLDRDFSGRFGTESYATEELVAELSAAFTSAVAGVHGAETRDDHVKYIASWIKVLKNDVGAIYAVSKAAQDATNMILGGVNE